MKKKKVIIEIENCFECPFHKVDKRKYKDYMGALICSIQWTSKGYHKEIAPLYDVLLNNIIDSNCPLKNKNI